MVVMLLFSVANIRRYIYEIFLKLHLILAAIVIAATYLHSPSKELLTSPAVYLFSAICLQIFIGVLQFGRVLYRNIKYKKPLNQATVRTIAFKTLDGREIPVRDAVHVHVQLSRPWKPRAGQYVYLCIPGVSYASFAQSHPFYVSWWYRDAGGNTVVVFIIQKRSGFTGNLCSNANNGHNSEMRAVIEGPYGKELDLESYGTVLLFATGIGIAGQLPYVTQLLEGYHNCEVKTRRIALFWELDSECKLSHTSM
jgi:predicted ferric reductase